MKNLLRKNLLAGIFLFLAAMTSAIASKQTHLANNTSIFIDSIQAKLLVSNIEGLSGIRQISPFHSGGAIPGNPEFLIETFPGRVLDPERLLVGSASNYGLKRYNQQMLPGMSLSLDVNKPAYVIPDNFALQGDQALNGKIMIYSAQSPKYINGYYNWYALTRTIPNIANPKYISINNAFGRPWHANAPFGINGTGFISVSDPDGRPLANPPSIDSGGVFFGASSNRIYGDYKTNTMVRRYIPGNIARTTSQQYKAGNLTVATISTVFLGTSPDSSNFAVFANVAADGTITQIHVQDGVDGLVDEAVIKPHLDDSTSAGTAFRWHPSIEIYVSDYYGDRVAVVNLGADDKIFHKKSITYITSPEIDRPVDIAASMPEIANPRFSSNTTLSGSSDLYIANKDGTILLMSLSGKLLAKVKVRTDFENSLNGEIKNICTSYDSQTLFIAMEGKNNKDFIVKIPAFNGDGFYPELTPEKAKILVYRDPQFDHNSGKRAIKTVPKVSAKLGEKLFAKEFGLKDGIRHVFNATSCVACHNEPIVGGFNTDQNNFARRVARYNKHTGQTVGIVSHNYPLAKRQDIRLFGQHTEQRAGIPSAANIVSIRMPLSLLHVGRLDEIPDSVLISHARSKGDGIQGRINYIKTKNGDKVGRFGWKANHINLRENVANALANEIGIDNSYTTKHVNSGTKAGNEYIVEAITKYLQEIDVATGVLDGKGISKQ